MPSLEPQGDKLQSLRRALGFTQLELALRAGVSERTVRNAERGRPINRDFLEYLAGALGVPLAEVVQPSGELDRHLRWQRNVGRMLDGLGRMLSEHDSSDLLDVSHREIVFHMHGNIPNMACGRNMFGEFRKESGIKRFVGYGSQYWDECGDVDHYIETPIGGGDTVVVRCGHEIPLLDGSYQWARAVYVCEFEKERLLWVDNFVFPGMGPPAGGLLLNHKKSI